MPCDVGACAYDPSPGDVQLTSSNALALYVWERLQSLGPAVWELVDLALTPAEAETLLEQLHTLETYSDYLQRLRQQDGGS